MKYFELGQSSIKASTVALGVMRLAERSEAEAAELMDTALACGVNFFDTADIYAKGESSRRLGKALRSVKAPREQIYLQTKFGIHRTEAGIATYDFSRAHLLKALDTELENLGTDYVDFCLLHRPDTLVDLDELASTFNELEASGKVRHFGVSNVNPTQLELLQSGLKQRLEVNQLQFGLGHSLLLDQEIHVNMDHARSLDHDGAMLAYSRLNNITLQAWSPLQYGFFEGLIFDEEKFPELNEVLARLAEKYKVQKDAIAVAWILRHPAHIQAVLGTTSAAHLGSMVKATDIKLTREEFYELYQAAANKLP